MAGEDLPGLTRQPRGTMPKIEALWAFVSVDPIDDNEGVCAHQFPGSGWMPLIAADEKRLNQLRPIAEMIAAMHPEYRIKLVKFSGREELEDIG
jgi:hypothetical protein